MGPPGAPFRRGRREKGGAIRRGTSPLGGPRGATPKGGSATKVTPPGAPPEISRANLPPDPGAGPGQKRGPRKWEGGREGPKNGRFSVLMRPKRRPRGPKRGDDDLGLKTRGPLSPCREALLLSWGFKNPGGGFGGPPLKGAWGGVFTGPTTPVLRGGSAMVVSPPMQWVKCPLDGRLSHPFGPFYAIKAGDFRPSQNHRFWPGTYGMVRLGHLWGNKNFRAGEPDVADLFPLGVWGGPRFWFWGPSPPPR